MFGMRSAVVVACLLLGGCSAMDSLNTMQFSAATEPYPANYRAAAREAIGDTAAGSLVSQPSTIVGESPVSPKRWYVCVRQPLARPLAEPSYQSGRSSAATTPNYTETVLILSSGKPAFFIPGPAPRLCDGAQFEPLA